MQKALYIAVREVLDRLDLEQVELWWGRHDALMPDKTFCVMHLLQIQDDGLATNTYKDFPEEFTSSTVLFQTALIQFTVIGEDSPYVASSLRNNILHNPPSRVIMMENGFAVTTRSSIRRIPQQTDTGWLDSYNFDISFSFYTSYTEEEEDYFDKVEVG